MVFEFFRSNKKKNLPYLFTQKYALPTTYTMSFGPIKLTIKTN